jgi:hypothetical protein
LLLELVGPDEEGPRLLIKLYGDLHAYL